MSVSKTEPATITAGDSVRWIRSGGCYPAPEYALSYVLICKDRKIEIATTPEGSDHLVSVPAATTTEWMPGVYHWQLYVVKGADRVTVDSGSLRIEPNFASLTGHDARNHVRKVLDAIEATLEGRATMDQQEYEILGRKLVKIPITDLLAFRDKYKAELRREESAERIAKGLGGRNRILTRI